MEEKLVKILNEMADYLNISQMKKLQETLLKHLAENEAKTEEIPNVEYLKMFIDAKQIEGCSERTLQYYRVTIEHMLGSIETPIRKITTDEIRVNSTTTVVMLIKKYVSAGPTQDYGKAAAYSVMLFAFTLIISLLFYKLTSEKTEKQGK